MNAPARPSTTNPFAYRPTPARRMEKAAFLFFRLVTYAILAFATFIFADITIKGLPVVTQKEFPFIKTSFLTEFPETLHVITTPEGELQMGDREFQKYIVANGRPATSDHKTFVYCAGGIGPAIVGTVMLVTGCIIIALVLGVAAAIFLSEYSKRGKFIAAVRLAIMNLAGVPSIVFGLFGFALFVLVAPILTTTPSNTSALAIPLFIGGNYLSFQGWGVSLLAGAFTLALMILPVIITASEEALRAVPKGFREGALALGATKWQTIRTNVIPYAYSGILTASVLGITRVAGETAPIMFTAAFVVRDNWPWQGIDNPFDVLFNGVMALPYHIYVLAAKLPQTTYTQQTQYGTVFVFMVIVMILATFSVFMRIKARKGMRW